MSPVLTIEEAKPFHCGRMARRLRREHAQALVSIGLDPHQQIRRVFQSSSVRKVAFLDGELAAMGGVVGTLASPFGGVWLLLSNEICRHPRLVLEKAREQLEGLLGTRIELYTSLLLSDPAAVRFAVRLGFHRDYEGGRGAAVSAAGRRALVRYLESDPEIRVPIGSSFAVAVGYHREEA